MEARDAHFGRRRARVGHRRAVGIGGLDGSVYSERRGANLSTLSAVDCTSATDCVAVGHADTGGSRSTLAAHWNGTSWTITPTPNPAGSTLSSLNGVSCPRAGVCFAVGGSSSGPLVELWNGVSWTILPSESVAGGELDAVSCSGLLACTAVGQYADGSSRLTLAERWDATGWHVQSTPNVAGAEINQLTGVSCPVKRTCTAVGRSTANETTAPIAARWFGRIDVWGLQAAPKPVGAQSARFAAVSCSAPLPCFATGNYATAASPTASSVTRTLAERRGGSTWSVVSTPNPEPGRGRPERPVRCELPDREVLQGRGNLDHAPGTDSDSRGLRRGDLATRAGTDHGLLPRAGRSLVPDTPVLHGRGRQQLQVQRHDAVGALDALRRPSRADQSELGGSAEPMPLGPQRRLGAVGHADALEDAASGGP